MTIDLDPYFIGYSELMERDFTEFDVVDLIDEYGFQVSKDYTYIRIKYYELIYRGVWLKIRLDLESPLDVTYFRIEKSGRGRPIPSLTNKRKITMKQLLTEKLREDK